jgi:hypothetical protein
MHRMAYEVSSVALGSLVKAAKELEVLDKALPRLSPSARDAVAAPHRQRWWPAPILQELTAAIAETSSREALTEANYRLTKESMGPIVMPIIRVAMALTGRNPATVFARLDDAMAAAMHGVAISWRSTGPNGGSLTFRYPEKVPRITHDAWEGVFRFAFELTGHKGRTVQHEYSEGDKVLRHDLEWS